MSASVSNWLLQERSVERSDAMIIELGVSAAIRVPRSADVVAHFVLDGTIDIEVSKMEQPVTLCQGEYGLVFSGIGHRICAGHHTRITREHLITGWPIGDEPPTLRVGADKPAARFISAALRLIHNPTRTLALHPLPELLPLKRDADPVFMSAAALLTDMRQIDVACCGLGATAFVTALMNLHLMHALRCAIGQFNSSFPVQPGARDMPMVSAAVRMLRTHPETNWTVAGLAYELGQSRSSFAAKFREHVGIGPMEYLGNIRMEKAAELLENEFDLPLLTIARRVGFGAASSFARAFKSHFGVSPRAFCEQGTAKTEIE